MGMGSSTYIVAFVKTTYDAAGQGVKNAYGEAWGNNANKILDLCFDDTVMTI